MAENNDAPLSAAQRSRIRRLSQPVEPQPGEEAGELNIVPYLDIIMNVMMFVLASVSVTFITSIDTTPPAIGGRGKSDVATKALNLSAFVTDEGISLKTSGGNIAPGCQGTGAGITFPIQVVNGEKAHDFAGITACAKKLKNASPDFKEETQVTITAKFNIDYETIVNTMDALRKDGEEVLFPKVHFGVVGAGR
ncbi:MAG TPA: biopolymer transporter ExbD [Polyangium sp.]|nr:biopolymer transporter ExbD [Polyangium sp.]